MEEERILYYADCTGDFSKYSLTDTFVSKLDRVRSPSWSRTWGKDLLHAVSPMDSGALTKALSFELHVYVKVSMGPISAR
jgi:hypothetical protein